MQASFFCAVIAALFCIIEVVVKINYYYGLQLCCFFLFRSVVAGNFIFNLCCEMLLFLRNKC